MTFAMKIGLSVVMVAACSLAAVAAYEYWNVSLLTRDFDPIIYKSRDGLCSVQPLGNRLPYCPGIFVDDPASHPSGQFIAAARSVGTQGGPPPHTRIVVANRRGADIRTLAGSDDFIRPVWAPNGDHVFAISYDVPAAIGRWKWPSGEKTIIPVRDLDTNCKALPGAHLSSSGLRPAIQGISFATSGRRVALLCSFQYIYLADVEPDGFRIRQMVRLSFSNVSIPAWLDDERFLVVARTARGSPAYLWQIDASSGSAHAVPTPELSLRDFVAISPDRRAVVVTATKPDALAWSLWRVDLVEAKSMRLTNGDEDIAPTWAQ